jgi:DNA-binding NtrC family response regulator
MEERRHVILLVDDEPLIRLALAEHLESFGLEVVQAANADAAIALLGRPDCAIDLLFTDVRMPGSMDGLGLSKWVSIHHPRIHIIIASGDVSKARAMFDVCGAEAIAKPFDYDQVTQKIRLAIAGCA